MGIQRWMNDTLKKFQQRNGVKVAATLMDTSNVIPQFTTARPPGVRPTSSSSSTASTTWRTSGSGTSTSSTACCRRRAQGVGSDEDVRVQGQAVSGRLLLGRVRDRLQQESLPQGRARSEQPTEDVGAVSHRLQEAQGEGLHSHRRWRQGRLPRRVVPGQRPHAEPGHPGRCAQPVHRKAELEQPALLRALVAARRAQEEGLLQQRHQLAAALPGHPAVRYGQGLDVLQHDAGNPELAEAARGQERGLLRDAALRRRKDGRDPDHRQPGLRHSHEGKRSRRRRSSSPICTRRSACRQCGRCRSRCPRTRGSTAA